MSKCELKTNKVNKQIKHSESGGKRKRTHLYQTWACMKKRCINPKNKYYHRYGGRGITVCKEWRNDYLSFKNWAMDNGYQDNLTIDRIDNNRGYGPDNCQWITNRENIIKGNILNRKLTFKNATDIRSSNSAQVELAKIYGVSTSTIWSIKHNRSYIEDDNYGV